MIEVHEMDIHFVETAITQSECDSFHIHVIVKV